MLESIMNTVLIVLLILLFVVPIGLAIFARLYRAPKIGKEAAAAEFRTGLIVGGVLIFIMLIVDLAFRVPPLGMIVMAILAAVQLAILVNDFIQWPKRREMAGAVLLNGNMDVWLPLYLLGCAGAVFFLGMLAIQFYLQYSYAEIIIVYLTMPLTALVQLRPVLGRMQFTENGLLTFVTFLSWDQIVSYEWKDRSFPLLFIDYLPAGSLNPAQKPRTFQWTISPLHKEAIEAFLQSRGLKRL